MVIAIVPMKIHSSRVPNKNIRLFNGKPLFYHIIQSLYECKSVEKVVVDTDSGFLAHKVLEHFPDVLALIKYKHDERTYKVFEPLAVHGQ